MNKSICIAAVLFGMSSTTWGGEVFNQGFETNTDGWFDSSSSWFGSVTRVSSGTGGITSASGSNHATFTQSGAVGDETGGFSRFDGYRTAWSGGFTASAAIYLDTSWSAGEGFDYSVAANGSDGNHRRDFIFHIAMDSSSGDLLIGGSNNTNFDPRQDLESINHAVIADSGWYTFEHDFRDAGDGSLAVDLNVYNSLGTLIFTETRNDTSDVLGSIVGGNRYAWFTNIDIAGGINVDDITLNVVPLPPAALAGLGLLAGCAGIRQLRRR